MDAEGIRQVAAMYGSPVDPRRNDLHINCPFGFYHSRGVDTSQGLSVKIAPGRRSAAYCFSCKSSGTLSYVFNTAAKLDSSFLDVAEFVASRDGPSLSGALGSLQERDDVRNETPGTNWGRYASRCARLVPHYLVDRGIVRADVRRWQLGFDQETQRAVYPVKDEHGKIVGCLRRAVHAQQEPRYLDTPGAMVWKKQVFYGEHRIDRTRSVAYVVEGPMGAIWTARALPNVLGMMGASTGIEEGRLEKLKRWGIRTVVLVLDSDKAGREAVYGWWTPKNEFVPGLRQLLRPHFVVKVARLPDGKDPDDIPSGELLRVVREAKYLEAETHLTGRTGPFTLTPSKSLTEFLKDRRR